MKAAIALALFFILISSVIAENVSTESITEERKSNLNLNLPTQTIALDYSGIADADSKQQNQKKIDNLRANKNKTWDDNKSYELGQKTEAEIWKERQQEISQPFDNYYGRRGWMLIVPQ